MMMSIRSMVGSLFVVIGIVDLAFITAFSPMMPSSSSSSRRWTVGNTNKKISIMGLNKPSSLTSSSSSSSVLLSSSKEEMSLEEEVEEMVQAEVRKTKTMSNLRNEKGVEYAPWMNISPEEEKNIRQLMREKAEARRKRQLQEQDVKGALLQDSQAQELSGAGLRAKVLDDNIVEISWSTSSEPDTLGYRVKRRAAKTTDFDVIASYETYPSLSSKGPNGGMYRFLDETAEPGSWVYRVTECEAGGGIGDENDLSQCLVEIQTEEEQRSALFAGVAIATVFIGMVIATTILDPVQ